VVFVDFLPPGDGIAGVCFLPTDFLADTFPFYGVPSFFEADFEGVYFISFSTLFPTSPAGSAAFFPAFALALDFALAFPLAPPLTLAAGTDSFSLSFFKASLPFS